MSNFVSVCFFMSSSIYQFLLFLSSRSSPLWLSAASTSISGSFSLSLTVKKFWTIRKENETKRWGVIKKNSSEGFHWRRMSLAACSIACGRPLVTMCRLSHAPHFWITAGYTPTHRHSVTGTCCGVNLRLTMSVTKARCRAMNFILHLNQTTFTIRRSDSQTEQREADSLHRIFTWHTQQQMLLLCYVLKNKTVLLQLPKYIKNLTCRENLSRIQ